MPTADRSGIVDLSGARLGNYRLVRMLGRGRMGAVYLADDTALLRPTAVKVLSWLLPAVPGQDPVEWFLSEARLVARINHPRVVQIYGAAQAGAHFYIAMEYIAGQSAEALLQNGPLSARRATDLVLQVAAALHAAHRVGVVHRDVKPANILLDHGGMAKLGDFGMALTASAARACPNIRAGTPNYTAPEIWLGSPASASADLYSLGATWFHLLTGRVPFPGTDSATVEQGHVSGPIPDPRELRPSVPESCALLVRRMLAKTPQERHSSAQVLLWDLRRLQQELETAESGIDLPRAALLPQPVPDALPASAPDPFAVTALAQVLSFARRPFVDLEEEEPPYGGEPLSSVQAELAAWAADADRPLLALTGVEGSGRTTLSRELARRLSLDRLVLYAGQQADALGDSLLQRLRRAAGALAQDGEPASRAEDRLDALLERLALERRNGRPPPLLILDGLNLPMVPESEAGNLIGAAAWVRSFKLMLIGPEGLAAQLASSALDLHGEPVPEVRVPLLDPAGVGRYVRAWLAARLAPRAPPILVSPDAVLLLASRSGGELARVNLLAENMLLLAATEGKRVLSSWHAWSVSGTERWAERRRIGSLPRRGPDWPAAAFLEVIDACRRAAGVPPFPRSSAAPGPGSGSPGASATAPIVLAPG